MNEHLHTTSQSGKIAFVVLAFLIGGIFGIGIGMNYQRSNNIEDTASTPSGTTKVAATTATPTASPSAAPTAAPINPYASWRTYTNTTYGFSFKYPSEWALNDASTGRVSIGKTARDLEAGNTAGQFIMLGLMGGHGAEGFDISSDLSKKIKNTSWTIHKLTQTGSDRVVIFGYVETSDQIMEGYTNKTDYDSFKNIYDTILDTLTYTKSTL